MQQTLTTSGAVDGALGGAFEIPYFWHWVEPNPRLGIVHLPDEQPLAALPPLEGYGRYQTFGHMDRDPTLYLGDLASETPGYRHDRAGTFYTFGWCSEREMALCTLLELWGYEVKIVQEGIHVTTRVWLQTEPPTEMVLDTTFNLAYFQDLEDGKTLSSWNEDLGEGTEIERYNGTCHSASELRQVGAIPVSSAAQDRLIGMAREWFEGGV